VTTSTRNQEVTMSDSSNTSVPNVEYNLITTLSNLLQGGDVLEQYANDAEQAGNSELAQLFRELQQSNNDYAQRFRQQLHHLMHH
jgi:hypothetical protein